jgi:hypothetical protein
LAVSSDHSSGHNQDLQAADADRRVREQVEDALELADYVVEFGIKNADGQPLAFADIATINATAGMLGILPVSAGANQGPRASQGAISRDQWAAFEEAYYRLAMNTSPVTAETLRSTKAISSDGQTAGRLSSLSEFLLGHSPAQYFTRRFALATILFAVFVVAAEWRINVLGLQEDAVAVQTERYVLELLLPWAYGGLGACAYLLRSAHYFIYQRTFDMRRTPEYSNRVLLGSISGGAIILFTNYLVSENATYTHFGSAALGFIAGYSTDFLFNTIERIVTAIFPKVAVETVPKDSSQAAQPRTRQPQRRPEPPDQNHPPKSDSATPKPNH